VSFGKRRISGNQRDERAVDLRPQRERSQALVDYLAARYPRCFFADPAQRQPLKHGIADDLLENTNMSPEKISQALAWYCGAPGYRFKVRAGAARLDLSGDMAGVVTLKEQQAAHEWIKNQTWKRYAGEQVAEAGL
jgi:sRNA-binding protein